MAFSGVRVTKKHLKTLHEIQGLLDEAGRNLSYCNDTTGSMCDGRRDEVDASKEEAEGEFVGNLVDMKLLINDILKSYGAD